MPAPRSAADELFARALAHHERGQDDAAQAGYLDVLRIDAAHLGALTNLGTLLYNQGRRAAARSAYRQAALHHPRDLRARINYGNALYTANEWYQAREEFEAALRIDPANAAAHQGLTYVFERFGDERSAARHRARGFGAAPTTYVPYRGEGQPISVLLLQSARGGNVDTERILDDRTFAVTKIFAEYADRTAALPFHTLAFNAIADAERCAADLDAAQRLLRRSAAPLLNPPAAVLATDRCGNAERLGRLAGVRAPRTRSYPRSTLAHSGAERLTRDGFTFPLLLRTPGFHTGEHFTRVEAPRDLDAALDGLPGATLTAIEFLDARGDDALTRKYRAMIVDGTILPLHLAVASDWMVHYFSAAMEGSPAHRAEEARFLDDMPAAIGPKAMRALAAIATELGLDYAGVDFGVGRDGELLLFEANAAMMIPPPPSASIFAYRAPAIERAVAAVRAMLLARAADDEAGA